MKEKTVKEKPVKEKTVKEKTVKEKAGLNQFQQNIILNFLEH